MASDRFTPERAVVVLVDLQKALLSAVLGGSQIVARSLVLAKAAKALGIPVLGTTQNAARLGELQPELAEFASGVFDKMTFSAGGSSEFLSALKAHKDAGRDQVFLVGVEAHICVVLTAFDLVREGYQVGALSDAIASRSEDRYSAGLALLNQGRIAVRHSESLVYEWMGTADHPAFKEVLQAVKATRY